MKQASRQAVPRALLRIGIVGLILAAGAGAGSLAYATIAAGPSVIHACYAPSSGGVLRIATRCRKYEKTISWNNSGPAGSQGPAGAQGAQGATGAAGATGATGATGAAGVNRNVIGGGDAGCPTSAGPATAYVGMFGAACGTETEVQLPMPANGTVQELHATLSVAPGSGNSVTFTIRKNGSSTSVTCTISGTATSCGDSSNAIGFATGDLISMQFVESAGVAANIDYGWTSQFVPS